MKSSPVVLGNSVQFSMFLVSIYLWQAPRQILAFVQFSQQNSVGWPQIHSTQEGTEPEGLVQGVTAGKRDCWDLAQRLTPTAFGTTHGTKKELMIELVNNIRACLLYWRSDEFPKNNFGVCVCCLITNKQKTATTEKGEKPASLHS